MRRYRLRWTRLSIIRTVTPLSSALALACFGLGALSGQAAGQAPTPTIEVSPTQEVVFRWSTDSCTGPSVVPVECVGGHGDLPDFAPRAFVDDAGFVQLVTPNDTTYRSIGDNLMDLTRDCSAPVMDSTMNATPRMYEDYEWLASTYTLDGRHIVGLVHNEYHGWCHNDCPFTPGPFNPRCAWASLTEVVSSDSGASYHHAGLAPDHVVANIPTDYAPTGYDAALQAFPGYRGPSNIISGGDGYYYALVKAFTGTVVNGGNYGRTCLIRTDAANLSVPSSWRAYDGTGFFQSLDGALCKAMPMAGMQWSFNRYLDRYLSVSFSAAGFGVFLSSFSDDMTQWSGQIPLMNIRLPWFPGTGAWGSYPALLQPGDPTRNFEQTGRSPYLYYVSQGSGMTGLDRDLVRRRVRFSLPGEEGRYDLLSLDMNERRGALTLDSSFYGNSGRVEGDTTWITSSATGPTALHFSGAPTSQVVVSPHPSLDVQGSLTIEAFVRIATLSNAPADFARIIRKAGNTPGTTNYSLTIPPASNSCEGRLFFAFSSGGSPVAACSVHRVDDGAWHHIGIVYDQSSSQASFYIDGALDQAVPMAGVLGDGLNASPVIVGSRIHGDLDGVRMYNYARAAASISQDSNARNRIEVCNGVDDDNDGAVDEDWPCAQSSAESDACPNGASGQRTHVCGLSCEWGVWSDCTGPSNESDAGPMDFIDGGLGDGTGGKKISPTSGCACTASGGREGSGLPPMGLLALLWIALRRWTPSHPRARQWPNFATLGLKCK